MNRVNKIIILQKIERKCNGVKLFIVIEMKKHFVTVKNEELVSLMLWSLCVQFVYLFSGALFDRG